jgi:integrase/recombinase XerD
LFSLLSATGLRISEALSLSLDDVGKDGLLIRQTKFKKSRLVPLHATASAGLNRYLDLRTRLAIDDAHVFVSLQWRHLSYRYVNEVFNHLIEKIELDSSGRRPHIHDIRHTFAVRVLESCCTKNRDAIDRNMLALSTYLGHANVADTYWYLEATPQLMMDIAQTCETFFKGRNES